MAGLRIPPGHMCSLLATKASLALVSNLGWGLEQSQHSGLGDTHCGCVHTWQDLPAELCGTARSTAGRQARAT